MRSAVTELPESVTLNNEKGGSDMPCNKRIPVCGMTVQEVVAILAALPQKQQKWVFTCCGSEEFWIHLCTDDEAVTMDTEEFICDDDEWDED